MAKGRMKGDYMTKENEFAFSIKEHIGVIAKYSTGWKKELNLVEWNGNNAKFDIRDHEHMSRGITLKKEEVKELAGLIFKFFANNKAEDSTADKEEDNVTSENLF